MMVVVKSQVIFQSSIDKVWALVTNLSQQDWRSQIDHIDVLEHQHFIEYDQSGYQTEFIIINKIENDVYEFNFKNENIDGHWMGKFKVLENGQTQVDLIESIEVKKRAMKLFAKKYLEKQQALYISDLKRALGE